MSYTIRFASDTDDETLPEGYVRNAFGQEVRVSYCCSSFAAGYDCGCGEW